MREIYLNEIVTQITSHNKDGDIPFNGLISVNVFLPQLTDNKTGLLLLIHGMGSDFEEHNEIDIIVSVFKFKIVVLEKLG